MPAHRHRPPLDRPPPPRVGITNGTIPISVLIEYFFSAPGLSTYGAAALYAISFVTSFLTTTIGLGGGLLMLGALATAFPPTVVVPLHGAVQLGSNAGRVLVMYRHIMTEFLLAFLLGSIAGAALGTQIYVALPTTALRVILGLFILYMLWGPPVRGLVPSQRAFLGLGGVATFASLFVGVTGPLVAPFIAAATSDRRDVVSTHAVMMMILHIFKIIAFGAMGFVFAPYLGLIAGMIATGFLGTVAGKYMLDRIPERVFRITFKTVMTLLALRLLYTAVA